MVQTFFHYFEGLISYYFPLTLLLLCGLYLTVKGRFFQVSKFPSSVKLIFKAVTLKEKKNGTVNSLQSACTALAATVGTGNIAGVAGAISIGGAGAVFWMWVSAFLGMAIKYAEITLAIPNRKKTGDEFVGGPMYYIKRKFPEKFKFLSVVFAFAGIPATFCSGNITQTNSAISSVSDNFYLKLILGVIFAIFTYLVIWGGATRIGAFTEKTVPIMSLVYIILSVGIILLNFDFLPTAFKMIINGAFNPKAVTGGCVGSVLICALTGASRGVFSNEAGLGTSAMAHSSAFDADEKTQGLFGIFEVFADTLVICTLTALTILCGSVNINYGEVASSELVSKVFCANFGGFADFLLAVMMCIFGFSSIVGWALYGNICASFCFGKTGEKLFKIVYPLGCVLGAAASVKTAWRFSEFFNGIMLCINLSALLFLNEDFFNILKGMKFNGKKD